RNRPDKTAPPHEVFHFAQIMRVIPEKPPKEGKVKALFREEYGGGHNSESRYAAGGHCFHGRARAISQQRTPLEQRLPRTRPDRRQHRIVSGKRSRNGSRTLRIALHNRQRFGGLELLR